MRAKRFGGAPLSSACGAARALGATVVGLLLATAPAANAADPQPYKVDMARTADNDLNATLKATSELETLRKSAPVGPFGLIGRARGDLERLKTVLESVGFYEGSVSITIDGRPLDDPGLGEELTSRSKGNDAQIKITFSTGPLYHLRTIQIDGEVSETARRSLALQSGAPATAAEVLAAGDRLRTALGDEGYAFAKVAPPRARRDPASHVLDVRFHVATGARVQIGQIQLQGLKDIDEAFIRKRLLVHAGEQYGATKLETARRDLLSLGVFSSVGVNIGTSADSEGRVPVTFQMREKRPHAVGFTAAYSSDLGSSAGVNWTKRNISGKADSLALSAKVINLGGGTASRGVGYDVNGRYSIPQFIRRDQTLQVSVGGLKQSLDAYDQTAATAGVTLTRKLSSLWNASVGFSAERERIHQECFMANGPGQTLDIAEQPQGQLQPGGCTYHYTLLALPITAVYNGTGQESPLADATHGLRLSLSLAPTFSIGAPSAQFAVIQVSGTFYFDLHKLHLSEDPGRSILAVRALAGLAAGAQELSLPPDQRFYAGGSGTIRGYRYQSVGPQFPDGNPIGGTAINVGSAEFRQRFGTNFGAAFFVDAGNVSRNLDPLNGALRFGTGAGVRYYTPIGPLRVDIAVPLNKRPRTATSRGDDSFEIYIGLGQAF
jgi:translocation and assembly module TamA